MKGRFIMAKARILWRVNNLTYLARAENMGMIKPNNYREKLNTTVIKYVSLYGI